MFELIENEKSHLKISDFAFAFSFYQQEMSVLNPFQHTVPPSPKFWTFRQTCSLYCNYLIFLFWIHFSCKCRFFSPGYLIWAGFCTGLTRFTKKRIAIFCEEINWWKKERCVAAFLALDWSFYLLFFCSRASPRDHKEALLHNVTATVK